MATRFSHIARYHGLPLLLYTALAILMTWPLARHFTTAVPGIGYDSWQNMWNMWWLKEALLHGHNPYYTTAIYYPHGTSLLLHTLNPINFLISLPVHALFGLVAAYNFVVLFSLSVSGYTAYLLASDVTGDRRAGVVAGAAYASSAYLLAQVYGGHTHMMAAEWLPLAVLLLRRACLAPGWQIILLAGLGVAINLLCDWQYVLFALLWGGWYGLAQVWQTRQIQAIVPVGLALGVAMLLVLPLLIPTARLAARTPTAATEGGPSFRIEHSADLADFLLPSQMHPVWGERAALAQQYKASTHIQNKTAYLGVVTLSLAAVGLRRRDGGFWLASAVVFAILAMGPRLQLFGTITDIPLPGAVLYELPLIRIFRYPIRFIVLTMLALSVLAAWGTQRLLSTATKQVRRSYLRQNVIVAVLVGLIVFDHLVTLPMVGIDIPAFYAEMSQDTDDYGIFEAPFYYYSSPLYMLYQTVHGKSLAGGYISRQLPDPLLEQFPLIQMFAFARPAPDIIGQEPEGIAASIFSYYNIRYLILHSDGGGLRYDKLMQVARAAAGGEKPRRIEKEKATFLVYRVASPDSPHPFIGIGQGWSEPEVLAEDVIQRRIAKTAEILIYSADAHRVMLDIQLHSTNAGHLAVKQDAESLSFDLPAGAHVLQVPLDVRAGQTIIRLQPDGMGDVVVRQVDLAVAEK